MIDSKQIAQELVAAAGEFHANPITGNETRYSFVPNHHFRESGTTMVLEEQRGGDREDVPFEIQLDYWVACMLAFAGEKPSREEIRSLSAELTKLSDVVMEEV